MGADTQFQLTGLSDFPIDNRSAGFDDVVISGAAMDSRDVAPGDLFIAIAGHSDHGLDHAAAATEAGALAVLHDRDPAPELAVPSATMSDLGDQAGAIAARIHDHPAADIDTVAVTGTDGKTSCAWLVAHAWAALGHDCGYIGTLGAGLPGALTATRHTTPDPVQLQALFARLRDRGVHKAVVEASSHALDQGRLSAVAIDTAVLTGIGRDHLDYHGSIEAYVAAKRRLFDRAELRSAVINGDDEIGRAWLAMLATTIEPLIFGRDDRTASHARFVHVTAVEPKVDGLVVTCMTHAGAVGIHSPLVGLFNAANLAAVLGVLLMAGIEPEHAADALEQVPSVPGRMERVCRADHGPTVVVDYAHTAGALTTALTSLRLHAARQLICVFGAGGDRDRGKRADMGRAVAEHADRIWITDDNPRHESPQAIVADIVADIRAETCRVVHDRRRAINEAIAEADVGDLVLIAGKGHETTQQYGDDFIVFDDRDVARAALEAA